MWAPSVHRPRRIGRQAGLGTVLTRARGHRLPRYRRAEPSTALDEPVPLQAGPCQLRLGVASMAVNQV